MRSLAKPAAGWHQAGQAYYDLPEQPYYDMSFANAAYEARLRAIESVTPSGSRVLDIGCNDGRIARHLLGSGRASRVTAVDIHDLILDKPPKLNFIRADVADLDLRALEPFEIVLALNVVHHLVARSRAAAQETIQAGLGVSPLMLVDMGSFTEHGSWRWRLALERHWCNDVQMWEDLFGSTPRRAVLRYAAMSGGHRTMWLLDARAKA